MTILGSKLSGYYFQDYGVWTSRFACALAFANEPLARDFISREHVADVQVIDTEVHAPGFPKDIDEMRPGSGDSSRNHFLLWG